MASNATGLAEKLPGYGQVLFPNKTEQPQVDTHERILEIPISKLTPFKNHPFQVNDDNELRELAKSISENGILIPCLARQIEGDEYELISGHRRKLACELLGIENMPVVVRELDDNAAILAMVDSNKQRENLLPSEKAYAYKMRLDAIKRVAGRPKNNSAQVGPNLKGKFSSEILAEDSEDSRNQIKRYIRLTHLIPDILKLVDEKKVAFNPSVEISYLPKEQQKQLWETMQSEERTPSLSQAQRLKQLSQEGKLSMDSIFAVMTEQKPNEKEQVKFKAESIKTYFPKDYSVKQMEDVILKLLTDWQKKRERDKGLER